MKRQHTKGLNPLLGIDIMSGSFWFDLLNRILQASTTEIH